MDLTTWAQTMGRQLAHEEAALIEKQAQPVYLGRALALMIKEGIHPMAALRTGGGAARAAKAVTKSVQPGLGAQAPAKPGIMKRLFGGGPASPVSSAAGTQTRPAGTGMLDDIAASDKSVAAVNRRRELSRNLRHQIPAERAPVGAPVSSRAPAASTASTSAPVFDITPQQREALTRAGHIGLGGLGIGGGAYAAYRLSGGKPPTAGY